MDSGTNFHDHIAEEVRLQANAVFDDTKDFDTANAVFNRDTLVSNDAILVLLLGSEFFTSWFFRRLSMYRSGNGQALKSRILKKFGFFGESQSNLIGASFIVNTA